MESLSQKKVSASLESEALTLVEYILFKVAGDYLDMLSP